MAAPFKVQVHKSGRRFTIPKHVREELRIKGGDSVWLEIRSADGAILFSGRKTLDSGPEICGTDIASALDPGSTLMVEASQPEFTTDQGSTSREDGQGIPRKGGISDADEVQRRFWIVSPNVTYYEDAVKEWRNASVRFRAASMGWGPEELGHKQLGYKFAHDIAPGDIILIGRRHGPQPDVVGFGVVSGPFETELEDFVAPGCDLQR